MPQKIEISHKTVIFIAVFILLIWVIFQIRDILFLLFAAFILMSGLRPLVDRLERWGIPRPLAIFTLYVLVFGSLGVFGGILFPPVVSETTRFVTQLPLYIEQIAKFLPFAELNFQSFVPQIAPLGQNVARITFGVFTNIIAFFTLFIFTFYLLLERKNLGVLLREGMGEGKARQVIKVILKIEEQIGGWIRGQLFLMGIIGCAVYAGLYLLKIPFALPLAVIAGLLEVIPNIGPTISAIPAILVAFAVSGNIFLALSVGALYFIINQLENTVIVPFIMKKVVGLPPLVTITALLIGGRLAGLSGIIFAVPLVLIGKTLIYEWNAHAH